MGGSHQSYLVALLFGILNEYCICQEMITNIQSIFKQTEVFLAFADILR